MRTKVNLFLITMLFFGSVYSSIGQNISMAKDLYSHKLKDQALAEFIKIFNTTNIDSKDRIESLYYMGQITFDDGQYTTALNDWNKLIETYPSSTRAIEIKDRLAQLNEVFSNAVDENISSSIAKTYINNGDFWSESDNKFTIDNSWMPSVELAISWYDKVISEFPKTYAAELAYQRKLFTILGWKESGQYGSNYGIRADYKKYLPILIQTFEEFESSFPESSFLQGFRYQIAQAYWGKKDWENTRIWLNKIIEKSNGKSSFYTETAKARLNKIEY